MKKVISLSLFGPDHAAYAVSLPAFVLSHANLFEIEQDWTLRIYIDDFVSKSKYGDFLKALESDNVLETRQVASKPLTAAMLYRVAPVFDSDVDFVFCRDLDACPSPRDRMVCEQFIYSNAVVHTVHDSQSHAGIMGGLCGFRAKEFREATKFTSLDDIFQFAAKSDFTWTEDKWAVKGTDQDVLARLVGHFGSRITLLEHRYSGWAAGKAEQNQAKQPSEYQCHAFSTLCPDVGFSRFPFEVTSEADTLASHMGAAGFDTERAIEFWRKYGSLDIFDRVFKAAKLLV